jgi:hypothetical protein
MNVVMLNTSLLTTTVADVIRAILNKPCHVGHTTRYRNARSRTAYSRQGLRGTRAQCGKHETRAAFRHMNC